MTRGPRGGRSAGRALHGAEAVVTDAGYVAALAAIRSLGRAGARVVAVAAEDEAPVLGFASRHAARRRLVPSPRRDPEAFRRALAELGAPGAVLLPVTGASTEVCVRHQAELARRFRFVLPSAPSFDLAQDKGRLAAFAASLGLPVPRSFAPGDRVPFPAVVKYRCGERLGLAAADRYAIVRDADELERAYRAMAGRQGEPLVQEWLPGEGLGCSVLMAPGGRLVAAFCHRRLRQDPPAGGPSTLAESVRDDGLVASAERLLRALDWSGHAMVEFRRDADGRPRLLEVNPRPWGTYPLPIRCGVDFPALYARVALGEEVDPVLDYPAGVRIRYLAKDFLAARAEGVGTFRYLDELRRLPAADPVLDGRDPLPALAYLWRGVRRRARSGAGPAAGEGARDR